MKKKLLVPSLLAAAAVGANAAVIHTGLLSYWTLDDANDTASSFTESTGTVADNLTTGGAGASLLNDGNGKFGGYGSYERTFGTDGRLAATTSVDLDRGGKNVSISLWMQYDDNSTAWQALISKGEGSEYRIARHSGNDRAAYAGGTGDIQQNPGGTAINDGAWHHIVATTTALGGVALYVDGSLEASGAGPATIASDGHELWIGNNPDSATRMWDGRIDDVAMWDRVINPGEVQNIYNAGLAGTSLGAIPEPSGVVALIGLAGVGLFRRRRK